MNTAIILAGGRGSRMQSDIPKQYIQLGGRPLLFYTIDAFEKCSDIDDIILVASDEYMEYCRFEIVEKYNLKKVSSIVVGGKERYDSVCQGLKQVHDRNIGNVLIHDGARACVNEDVIKRCIDGAGQYQACIAAVPVKDTIKVADAEGFASHTPDRKMLWQIQTPQAFQTALIYEAYKKMYADVQKGNITDDAMVVEKYTDADVKLVMGDYHNIKVTTPEDLDIAKLFLNI